MSINEGFEETAETVKGEFTKKDNKYKAGGGSQLFSTTYSLQFEHKEQEVYLTYELGHTNIASIKCKIKSKIKNSGFKISTIGPWKQLFNKKKPALSVHTINKRFKDYVESCQSFDELNKIAKKENFVPSFSGVDTGKEFLIECEYHLIFDKQELVLLPICKFYMDLIDFFLMHKK